MTEYTRPATWEDLLQLVQYLDEENVEYALIGGYAIAVHGFNRFSEDIDILVNPSTENAQNWIRALSRLPDGAAKELPGNVFETEGHYAIRINDVFTIDIMPAACGHSWEELKNYRTAIKVNNRNIVVLNHEGLLLTKEGMRERDMADARVLRAVIAKKSIKQ